MKGQQLNRLPDDWISVVDAKVSPLQVNIGVFFIYQIHRDTRTFLKNWISFC